MTNNRDFTQDGVMDRFREVIGRRFTIEQMAREFECDEDDMHHMLAKLLDRKLIEMAPSGRKHLFFIRTEDEKLAIDEMDKSPMSTPAKPYRQAGHAWDTVRERLADFRRIPSIKITGENV